MAPQLTAEGGDLDSVQFNAHSLNVTVVHGTQCDGNWSVVAAAFPKRYEIENDS